LTKGTSTGPPKHLDNQLLLHIVTVTATLLLQIRECNEIAQNKIMLRDLCRCKCHPRLVLLCARSETLPAAQQGLADRKHGVGTLVTCVGEDKTTGLFWEYASRELSHPLTVTDAR
jgi:hypothetical protein